MAERSDREQALRDAARTDEELADRLLAGDQEAFEVLVRRHHGRVRSLCYRMTGTRADAEDLSQETFLRVFRHRETYQSGRRFRVWLDRICMNVCLTHQERIKRTGPIVRLGDRTGELPAGALVGAAERQDPEARAQMNEMLKSVAKVTQDLPAQYRAALVLRIFGGLSYQEIADVLGISMGTVMSRINRARIRVRNQLKDL